MPTKSSLARTQAKFQMRDEHGHFVKGVNIKTSVDVNSPVSDLKTIPEFEKPLVSLSVNNPFKKILYWLDQIRRHQTTTFALKISIPLIALPVVIVGVFSLGRAYGISFQKAQVSPTPPPVVASPAPVEISRAGTLKIAKSTTQIRYLLSLKNGEIVTLVVPTTIDLTKYANKQVLVTGSYNKNTGILTVSDIAEITIFNPTVIPESTQSAQ